MTYLYMYMKKNEQLIFFIFSICHKWLIPDVLIYEMLLKDVDFLLCDIKAFLTYYVSLIL